jgi:integrase
MINLIVYTLFLLLLEAVMNDIKINYYLKEPTKKKTPIVISVIWDGLRLKTTFGIIVESQKFDKDKQRIKTSYSEAFSINEILRNIENSLREFYFDNKAKKIPTTADSIKNRINETLKPKEATQTEPEIEETFLGYLQDFINLTKKGGRLNGDGRPISRGTYKTYISLRNHLEDFEENYYELSFDKMNKDFFIDFVGYLRETKSHSHNYIVALIKILKVFLHYSLEKKIHSNIEFLTDFKMKKKDVSNNLVALTLEDLKKIEDFEPTTASLEHIKDNALFLAYTGLRYSDFYNLQPDDIDLKKRIIKLITLKTGKNIVVPIGDKLEKIILKYDKNLHPLSNQKLALLI